jgi:hypothetical protein
MQTVEKSALGASLSDSVNVNDTDIVTKASTPDDSAKMEVLAAPVLTPPKPIATLPAKAAPKNVSVKLLKPRQQAKLPHR